MRRIRQVFGRSFTKINAAYARILGQPHVGDCWLLGWLGCGLVASVVMRARRRSEGGDEEQGKAEHEQEEEERGKKESSGGFTREF